MDGSCADSELYGESAQTVLAQDACPSVRAARGTLLVATADYFHLGGTQLPVRFGGSSTSNHVSAVLGGSPRQQMGDLDAGRPVACVPRDQSRLQSVTKEQPADPLPVPLRVALFREASSPDQTVAISDRVECQKSDKVQVRHALNIRGEH